MKKIKLSQIIVILITVMMIGIAVLNIVLMYDIAAEQTEEIGRMRIQNIAAGFQKSLTRAENTFERVSSDFEDLLLEGATEEEIRLFLAEQRNMEYALSEGCCLNVFCVVDGVVMISDMDTPEDYVLQDRGWYRGLLTKKKGEIYISPAYEDAFTDNMCFTMARMLDDGETLVGIDYSVSEIQSYVAEMNGDGYGDAMIVDENETIVGYTDPNMIGKKLSSELPQYRNAFLRAVAADMDNFSLQNGVGTQSNTIFCSRTENGWYMMCSVSNWSLYRESYIQLVRNSVGSVLFALVIVAFYFIGQRSRRKEDQDTENLPTGNEEINEKKHKKRHIKITEKEQRNFQVGITSIFVFTMIIVIAGAANMTISGSRIKMEEELRSYNDEVGDWILEQKSILDMFENVVAAKADMLDDYEGMVKFLDDITKHYPKISATYIANPGFPHGHPMVMNNGWVPEEDYVEEERPWYIGALTAEEFNITEPYYDARTGEYCITFSRVVESDKGEFYGVFAIDFYLDVLMDILDQSYTESGYAFLVDKNGLIIDHPNSEYRLSDDESVNIHNLIYDRLYSQSDMVILKDYDGKYKVCSAMDEGASGFRIIVVKDWWEIYGNVIEYTALFLVLFGVCIFTVNKVISRMIHWQRNTNEELKKAADSAIRAEQAKSLFLSNMSHEIRTPINAILGMNEMILRECKDNQLLVYSGNIQSSGRTLLTLINDILDMSKIESGKMEIISTEYKTADLIIDLWNVIYLRAKDKNLTVSFTLDETMPSILFGDDVRVKQIVTNLLTNAVKYTPKGGVKLHASYEKQREDTVILVISVQDTGIGIKEEDIGRMFDNFQRLEEDKNRNIEGTGLGMSITTMLLKMMGGDIDVESVYQQGSTFTVRIPQKVISSEPVGDFESIRNRQAQIQARHYGHFEAPEANILVVDDNTMNLVVFTSLLKLTKMNIVTAESGMECLELVKEQPFHIIFMDHMMPGMDGVETLHEIKKMKDSPNVEIPVVALTANAVSGAKEYYLKEGFSGFLTKPLDSDKLERLIVEYLPKELVHEKDDAAEESGEEDGTVKESDSADYSRYQDYGISIEKGLSHAAGNTDLYLNIVEMFIHDKEKQDQLKQFLAEGNSHDYGIQVHALKGNARTLGAENLADVAYEHEKQSKAGNLAYAEEHWDELVENWEKAREGFEEFYGASGRETAAAPVAAVVETDAGGQLSEVTAEEISEVVSLIEAFETPKAVERMKEWLKKPLQQEQRTLLDHALAAIEKEYDEDKAIEILKNQ